MLAEVKNSMKLGVLLGLFSVVFLQNGAFAQQKSSFKVGGPCMACGAAHIESLVKGIDGVSSASFDAGKGILTIDFSPVAASLIDIQLELSINGYDAGDFGHDAKAKLPPCAGAGMRGDQAMDADIEEPGMDDIEGLEADGDWETMDSFDVAGNTASVNDDVDFPEDDESDDINLDDWGTDDEKVIDAAGGDDDDDVENDDL